MGINVNASITQMQNETNRINYQNAQKNLGNSRLDREGFIRLILAQLQYQDPTEPQDNAQMLEQQLQLEQADQMNSLVNANKFSQAGSLVGQTVDLPDSRWDFNKAVSMAAENEYDPITKSVVQKQVHGVVESVQFDRTHNKALLLINGRYYDADLVRQVNQTTPTTPPAA